VEAVPAVRPDAQDIAAAYGSPAYVLDLERLDANYEAFAAAWERASCPISVFYSVKTNYLPIVCRRLRQHGAGADVVSGNELDVALAAGFPGKRIVLNGPMKTPEEIERAVALEALINVDALGDIDILEEQARRSGRHLEVGLRVNPSLSPYTSPDPSYAQQARLAARRSKFGWPLHTGAAASVADRIRSSPHLRLSGLHCQLGSQVTDTDAFLAAVEKVCEFATTPGFQDDLRTLNLGGGFGVSGIKRHRLGPIGEMLREHGAERLVNQPQEFDLGLFARGIAEALERHRLGTVELACEPGRILVSDAISLLTTVVSLKDIGEGTWVILDAGVNLLPTAGPGEEHEMTVVGREGSKRSAFMVAGPLCYDQDVFSHHQLLADDIAVGDLVEVRDAGAYSITRATNFIRGRAPVVATAGGVTELCWSRESSEDVFAPAVQTSFETEDER
jgi:diaminopimelate decarboxylase